jgi:TRAP-type C4-dicarboxylate transport system substrate-binding protein
MIRTLIALAAAFAFAGTAHAQLEIKLGHVGEPGSVFQKSADEYAKRANAKLGAKAKVVVYGSSQLGSDEEMIQKLKLGTIDMAVPSTVMSSQVDLFGVFEMPYLVKDRAHMMRIEKELFWSKLAPEAEKKGLRCSRSGRTAFARSPTASGRSARPPTSRGSSCASRAASGASRCSRPTARTRAR